MKNKMPAFYHLTPGLYVVTQKEYARHNVY